MPTAQEVHVVFPWALDTHTVNTYYSHSPTIFILFTTSHNPVTLFSEHIWYRSGDIPIACLVDSQYNLLKSNVINIHLLYR